MIIVSLTDGGPGGSHSSSLTHLSSKRVIQATGANKTYEPEMPSHFMTSGVVVGMTVGNGIGSRVGEPVGTEDGLIAARRRGSCTLDTLVAGSIAGSEDWT